MLDKDNRAKITSLLTSTNMALMQTEITTMQKKRKQLTTANPHLLAVIKLTPPWVSCLNLEQRQTLEYQV